MILKISIIMRGGVSRRGRDQELFRSLLIDLLAARLSLDWSSDRFFCNYRIMALATGDPFGLHHRPAKAL